MKFLANKRSVCAALILLFLPASYANAYLDPGSTSLIIQGIIAAIASVATIASIYWQRLKSYLKKMSPLKKQEELDPTEDDNQGS